jgi:hypothetical protein
MSDSNKSTRPNGTISNGFFENLGRRAEHITASNEVGKSLMSANAVKGTDSKTCETYDEAYEEEGQKAVDKIESLCMNCFENVLSKTSIGELD